MAVTSIWPVTVRLNSVIRYACNPEKTTQSAKEETAKLHKIKDVVQYTANDMKTEQREYVSGINCNEAHAADDFMATKKHWEKTNGRLCYHGYQSFAKGETTAETAHAIGVELAKRLWGDRFEVLVATHCNTGCYHNHFVINSVSFLDGYKFYNSPADYQKMREESDRLCIEYGLSVIPDTQGHSKNYSEWQAERNGKPVIRGTIRQDIDAAITAAADGKEFIRIMEEKSYEFKFTSEKGTRLKWPSVKPPDSPRYYRLERLGEQYSMGAILERLEETPYRDVPFSESDRKAVSKLRRSYRGEIEKRKATGIYALYLRYCYELRIIQRYPASAKRVSFFMREDLTKLSQLDAQALFLGRTGIKTIEELKEYKGSTAAQIESLTAERTTLRNEMRRLQRQNAYGAVNEIKVKITGISQEITRLRKEISLCEGNPFVYLRDDNDIQRLVTNLFKNTTPKGSQSQDPFWDQAATMLLLALMFYLRYEAPPDEQNFPMVMEMIRAGDVREDNEDYLSALDRLFEKLERRNPEHVALKYYRSYHSGSGKTLKSIQISLISRLEKFNLNSLASITQNDEMELWSLGEKKTAVFAVIPDNDSSFNFLVGMLYTQLFQQLYYQADIVHGGRLPIHVHFVMDEFANVALPDEFDKLLSTMRSREISVSIIIQNLAQLKALFEKQWESIVGNCDEFLYLGGNEQSTHEYVSKLLGKETIDLNTYGQSKGRSGNYSTNWQITGRELMTPDEVRMLDNKYALLFIRGERPVQDFKYDILKHPNVALTTDGTAAPYRHGEDTLSIASIQLDEALLSQAEEPDLTGYDFELLTEEELEAQFNENGGTKHE